MDVNEEEILISLRNMRNSDDEDEPMVFGNSRCPIAFHQPNNIKAPSTLQWLDLKVFYVRVDKRIIDNDSTSPDYLTLNHVPLNCNTLLEVNCVRTSVYSDRDESTLLKRDRSDKRSEEVTFVSTNSIRMTGSVRFEIFNKEVLVLSGILEMCRCGGNGCIGNSKNRGPKWSMNCEPDVFANDGLLKGSRNQSPAIEVYVAGSFLGKPITLTKTLQLVSYRKKKQTRKGMLECIPEHDVPQTKPSSDCSEYEQEDGGQISPYLDTKYLEGEDEELSRFNVGVTLGVGIGVTISVGVGLLVRTYQRTAGKFRSRQL